MADEKRSTINIRLGESLLQTMREEAARHARSMNAEIVRRLEASLPSSHMPSIPETADITAEERALVRMWRALGSEEKRSVSVLLRAATSSKSD
ncbi:Arc family DNA-binding protein [Acetobacter senegalensis]|uniref:Arc family DNA-binding protein n=1 Tax=Acetobacter senegalensis TaxID=446692 RepID=UPI0038D20A1E|nr:Arc family DNA-binding protein [Acetobacter senegalensis]